MSIVIVANNRSELGPLTSVIAALPEAEVVGLPEPRQVGHPSAVMSYALTWFTMAFEQLKPRVVVLLGDRYETLSAALAATFLRIKLVHIHGGETTTGAFDDALRHSITHLTEQSGGAHCVATAAAAVRIWGMTKNYRQDNDNCHIVGAPGLDGVAGNSWSCNRKLVLATFHPETRTPDYGAGNCYRMLQVLADTIPNHEIFFATVNNDPGSDTIRHLIEESPKVYGHSWSQIVDFKHDIYAELMQQAAFVVGNSSAGKIEAPWIGVPSVDVGPRQDGRPSAPSVFHSDGGVENTQQAVYGALAWKGPWEPVYRGGAAPRIAEIVRGMV